MVSVAGMGFFRSGKLRLLYVLALVQLVGGPLVLFQVSVFCKLALHEAPRIGVAKAAELAWKSERFQAVLVAGEIPHAKVVKPLPGGDGPKAKVEKVKQPVIPWMNPRLELAIAGVRCTLVDRERVWTPAWPQAPPGPPPCVG